MMGMTGLPSASTNAILIFFNPSSSFSKRILITKEHSPYTIGFSFAQMPLKIPMMFNFPLASAEAKSQTFKISTFTISLYFTGCFSWNQINIRQISI